MPLTFCQFYLTFLFCTLSLIGQSVKADADDPDYDNECYKMYGRGRQGTCENKDRVCLQNKNEEGCECYMTWSNAAVKFRGCADYPPDKGWKKYTPEVVQKAKDAAKAEEKRLQKAKDAAKAEEKRLQKAKDAAKAEEKRLLDAAEEALRIAKEAAEEKQRESCKYKSTLFGEPKRGTCGEKKVCMVTAASDSEMGNSSKSKDGTAKCNCYDDDSKAATELKPCPRK